MIKPIRKMPIVASTMILLIGYLPVAFGHEVSLSCPTAFGPVPDASGLIAYYPLDGNTADVSGNGMDAIEVNAANPAEGKVGQGYHFNGKDSYIRLPLDISPFAYSQITITAWIKPEALNGARYVINQGDHGNRNLFISNGSVSAGRALVGNPKHTIYADRWTFVALTYDQAAGTAVLLSGSTISMLDKVVIPELPRPSVLLGAKAPGNSGFAGVIDEVRIYNRALTTTELAGLSRAGSGTTVAGSISPNQLPGDQFGSGIPTQSSAPQGINTPSISTSNPFGDDVQSIGPTGQPGNGDSSQPGIPSENQCATVDCPMGQICVNGGCFDAAVLPTGPGNQMVASTSSGPGLEGTACSLILPASSGGVLAGRWQTISSTEGGSVFGSSALGSSTIGSSALAVTVDFYGPDSNLSGHIWVVANSWLGETNVDEPLSSVSLTGSTARFSSPNTGESVGVVSSDGSKITVDVFVLERVVCGS